MLKSLCNIAEGFFMLCKSLKTAAMPSNRAFKAVRLSGKHSYKTLRHTKAPLPLPIRELKLDVIIE